MNSHFDQTSSHTSAAVVLKRCAILVSVAMALQGCALEFTRADDPPPPLVTEQAPVLSAPAAEPVADDVDVLPPLPTFTTLADCESAYGADNCATGETIYVNAEIAAPAGSAEWFIPYQFAVMTAVLSNHYFAPPAAFRAEVDYGAFTDRVALYHYRTINHSQIDSYRHAPAEVRARLAHSGPARYSPSRGEITGRLVGATASSHAHGAGYLPTAHAPSAAYPPGVHAPTTPQPLIRPTPMAREHTGGETTYGGPRRPEPSARQTEFAEPRAERYQPMPQRMNAAPPPRAATTSTVRSSSRTVTTGRSSIKQ
jgi:hypothetical protein